MKRYLTHSLLLLLSLLTVVQAQERPLAPPPQSLPPPLRVTVREGSFQSAALGRPMRYRIILPSDYEAMRRRYPVLYLLHGLTGDYADWESKTNLAEYAQRLHLIIVMPDGNDAWYTNSAGDPQEKYEDYIAKDLIAEIDEQYRTISARYARAMAGLSMGGYGAMKFGLKYPQTFAFAASFSGALQVARDADFLSNRPGKSRDGVMKIFGPAGSQTRAENDLYALVKKADPARMPYFYLDCGTEDGLLQPNREFVALLHQQKIAYEYRELPGAHAWDYWDRQVRAMFEVLAQRIDIRRER